MEMKESDDFQSITSPEKERAVREISLAV